jgi:hypothetical protein
VDDRSHACPIALYFWLTVDDSKVLPPTILTWRDLQILEGIAEQGKGGCIVKLLIMWRLSNYQKLTHEIGLPMSLPDFIDRHFTLGRPMPAHDRTVGTAFLQAIHEHAQRRLTDAEQHDTMD